MGDKGNTFIKVPNNIKKKLNAYSVDYICNFFNAHLWCNCD